MDDIVKQTFFMCIGIAIAVMITIIPLNIYYYKINSKFIENGYQQQTVQGWNGLVWQKLK